MTAGARAVDTRSCQFCERQTPAKDWRYERCPECGEKYGPNPERFKAQAEIDVMRDDLLAIGKALGIPARPYSGHEAVQRDYLPRIAALAAAEADRNRLKAQVSEMQRAAKLLPRPWIDGGVTWKDWDKACEVLFGAKP